MKLGLWVAAGLIGALPFGYWGAFGGILAVEAGLYLYGLRIVKGTLVPKHELTTLATDFVKTNPSVVEKYFGDDNKAITIIIHEIDGIYKRASLNGKFKSSKDFSSDSIHRFFTEEINRESTTHRKEYLKLLQVFVLKIWY
jgi:hypothetical protein